MHTIIHTKDNRTLDAISPLGVVDKPSGCAAIFMKDRDYYVYVHRDNNFMPFYVGFGRGKRAYITYNRSQIWKRYAAKYGHNIDIEQSNLTLPKAIKLEKHLISKLGRKNLATGCLVNLTDGGEGRTNIHSKKVKMYTKAGRYKKTFYSIEAAARYLGLFAVSIKVALDKINKSAGGYVFRTPNSNIPPIYTYKWAHNRMKTVSSYNTKGYKLKTFSSLKACAKYYKTYYQAVRASILGATRFHKGVTFRYGDAAFAKIKTASPRWRKLIIVTPIDGSPKITFTNVDECIKLIGFNCFYIYKKCRSGAIVNNKYKLSYGAKFLPKST